MLLGSMKESQLKEIVLQDMSHLVLLAVVEYCYTDDIKYLLDQVAVELLFAANLMG